MKNLSILDPSSRASFCFVHWGKKGALPQPRTQASSRYPSYQRRLGTKCDSELSRQAWQVTSHPKSPRTTGNEAGRILIITIKHYKLCLRFDQKLISSEASSEHHGKCFFITMFSYLEDRFFKKTPLFLPKFWGKWGGGGGCWISDEIFLLEFDISIISCGVWIFARFSWNTLELVIWLVDVWM